MTDDKLLEAGKGQIVEEFKEWKRSHAKICGAKVNFYKLSSKERHEADLTLEVMNNVIAARGCRVLDWAGPSSKRLRLEIEDSDGFTKTWYDDVNSKRKTSLALFMVEVVVQHPVHGYIVSADMYTVSDVFYDTQSRDLFTKNELAIGDVRATNTVIDFEITHSSRIDDGGFLDKVLNENPSMVPMSSEHALSTFELIRAFLMTCTLERLPLNHLFQVMAAFDNKAVKQKIIETVAKHKGK